MEHIFLSKIYTITVDNLKYKIWRMVEDSFLVLEENSLEIEILNEEELIKTFKTLSKHKLNKI